MQTYFVDATKESMASTKISLAVTTKEATDTLDPSTAFATENCATTDPFHMEVTRNWDEDCRFTTFQDLSRHRKCDSSKAEMSTAMLLNLIAMNIQ